MDINVDKIEEIIGNHHRFISPFSEPYAYYIFTEYQQKEDWIEEEWVAFYLKKLKYAVQNADFLIEQAFCESYYEWIKNHSFPQKNALPQSPHDMCQQLRFESFVLCPKQHEIGSVLSNPHFMFGHFIDCRWDYNWNLLFSSIC